MQFLTAKITRQKLDKFLSGYQTDQPVLDVGCGGRSDYAKYFSGRIGLDIKAGPGVDIVASAYELPFDAEKFGQVLCISVLEHLQAPEKALADIRRVLKTGGRLIASVPFLFPIHDAPADYWRFTKYGLQKLLATGWEIESLEADTSPQEFIAASLQRLGYQSSFKLGRLTKGVIFIVAKIIEKMPNLVKKVFGDIHKSHEETGVFAMNYLLVARKIEQ